MQKKDGQLIKHLQISTIAFAFIIIALNFRFSNADTLLLKPIIIAANYSHPYRFSLNSTVEYVFIYGERGVSISFLDFLLFE
jgi:hypothetical protein